MQTRILLSKINRSQLSLLLLIRCWKLKVIVKLFKFPWVTLSNFKNILVKIQTTFWATYKVILILRVETLIDKNHEIDQIYQKLQNFRRWEKRKEEHATLEEQKSTQIQMVVSAIGTNNKKRITTIKKKRRNKIHYTEAKKQEKPSRKIAEEIPKTLAETKNIKAYDSPILEKINECISLIVRLFTYKIKLQQHQLQIKLV